MNRMASAVSEELILPKDSGVVVEGNYYMVKKLGGEHIRSMRITKKQNILIEKLRLNSEGLIGKPFGLFEVGPGGQAVPFNTQRILDTGEAMEIGASVACDETQPVEEQVIRAPSGDQTVLKEAQARQKYTEEAIDELKKKGTTASELVAKLVEGNATFHNRTEYAKSKYIRKKAKKHSDKVLILRPTIRLLCESYYRKDPERTGNMRYDQLGLILQMAAINSGKKVVVFEQSCGLVTSAVLERLSGRGSLVHLHRGRNAQSIPCVHSMNYPSDLLSTFHPVRIRTVLNNGIPEEETEGYAENAGETDPEGNKNSTVEENSMDAEESPITDPADAAAAALGAARRAERLQLEKEGFGILAGGVDAIIITTRTVDPISILETLYQYLKPSGTMTVYGPVLQPIVETQTWMRSKESINVQLANQMFRIHQVLPQRTHPLMSQMVVGGTIVSGIKVIPQAPLPPTFSSSESVPAKFPKVVREVEATD